MAVNVGHEMAFGGKMPMTGVGRAKRRASMGAESPSTPASSTAPVMGPFSRRARTAPSPSRIDSVKRKGGENGVGWACATKICGTPIARAAAATPTSSGCESPDTSTAPGRRSSSISRMRAYQAMALAARQDTRNP